MVLSHHTCRQRRWRKLKTEVRKLRRWFWGQLLNRHTWISVVKTGIVIYRIYRWINEILDLFG